METQRLRLIQGTGELARLERTNLPEFARQIGASVPASWPLVPAQIIEFWERRLRDAGEIGWWNWYFVLRGAPDVLVGGGGFKGRPSPEGIIEIGYSVAPEFQNQGYATEGVGGLIEWAFGQTSVKSIIAEVFPGNLPSLRVLEKNDFASIGEGAEQGTLRFQLMARRENHGA